MSPASQTNDSRLKQRPFLGLHQLILKGYWCGAWYGSGVIKGVAYKYMGYALEVRSCRLISVAPNLWIKLLRTMDLGIDKSIGTVQVFIELTHLSWSLVQERDMVRMRYHKPLVNVFGYGIHAHPICMYLWGFSHIHTISVHVMKFMMIYSRCFLCYTPNFPGSFPCSGELWPLLIIINFGCQYGIYMHYQRLGCGFLWLEGIFAAHFKMQAPFH